MWILVPLLMLAATRPLVVSCQRGRGAKASAGVTAIWLACAAIAGAIAALHDRSVAPRPPPTDRPLLLLAGGYVGSGECRACHPREHASWRASYHSSMTQLPSSDSIAAPWDGLTLEHLGSRYELHRRADRFTVVMDDPHWRPEAGGTVPRVEREVVQVTGSHHAQVYWFSAGKGRNLAMFAFAYRIDLSRWVPFDDIFLTPPGVRQPTEEGARWSNNCFKCHSTNGRPRLVAPFTNDAQVSEMGIACEACHGPGSEHVASYRNPLRRGARRDPSEADPTIVNPAKLSAERSSMVCGQCHSSNHPIPPADPAAMQADFQHITSNGFRYRPGDDLLATAILDSEGGTRFWADGMLRVTGREYHSLRRTPCHVAGALSCLSCHVLHPSVDDPRSLEEWRDDQLRPEMRGNAACSECHPAQAANPEAHSHHRAGSSGAECMNCHMPHTAYGLLKAIRTHEITSPRAETSLQTGRPNACNLCHLDRTLEWTAARLDEWYAQPLPDFGAAQEPVAAGLRWVLAGDAGQRALVAWSMGWPPAQEAAGIAWQPAILAELLDDPYHPVRLLAIRALRQHAPFADLAYDSLGTETQLRAAQATFLESARRQEEVLRISDRPELLRDAEGRLREDRVRQLLEQRDDRPIYLAE